MVKVNYCSEKTECITGFSKGQAFSAQQRILEVPSRCATVTSFASSFLYKSGLWSPITWNELLFLSKCRGRQNLYHDSSLLTLEYHTFLLDFLSPLWTLLAFRRTKSWNTSGAERKAYSHPLSKLYISLGFQKCLETPSAKSLSLVETYQPETNSQTLGAFTNFYLFLSNILSIKLNHWQNLQNEHLVIGFSEDRTACQRCVQ